MHRAALAFALVACGARTELGARTDAGMTLLDAPVDVAVDVTPSKCPPIEYVNDDQSSTAFAIDDTSIHFVLSPCEVQRVAKDDTGGVAWSMDLDCAGDIVVDDLDVYWTSVAGHLMRHSKNGDPGTQDLGCAALAGCPGNVHVRAVAKDVVVLVDGFRPVAMPKTAGLPYPLMPTGFAPPAPVHYVFVDDTRAYWNTDIRVLSSALDGSSLPKQYATFSNGLAIDSAHVYWTTHDGGAFDLLRADKDGSNVATLSTSDTITPLVASDAFVYGVSPAGITRQPASGSGAPIVIVPNVHPLVLALDEACIYFAEKTANGRRIARHAN